MPRKHKFLDRDGEVWTLISDDVVADVNGTEWDTFTVIQRWGPLTPHVAPSLWARLTARWPGRFAVVMAALNLGLLVVVTVFAIVRSEPSLYLTVSLPALCITVAFPLAVIAIGKTLIWIWPTLNH